MTKPVPSVHRTILTSEPTEHWIFTPASAESGSGGRRRSATGRSSCRVTVRRTTSFCQCDHYGLGFGL